MLSGSQMHQGAPGGCWAELGAGTTLGDDKAEAPIPAAVGADDSMRRINTGGGKQNVDVRSFVCARVCSCEKVFGR